MMMKKLVTSFLISLVLLMNVFVPVVQAQGVGDVVRTGANVGVSILDNSVFGVGPWYNQTISQYYTKVYDDETPPTEIYGERYTAAQVDWIIWTVLTWPFTKILGPNLVMCPLTFDADVCGKGISDLLIATEKTEQYFAIQREQNTNFIGFLFSDRPLSGITYTKDLVRKFHIIPEAQAQGFGFSALDPIQDLWAKARDVSYGLFILAIIVFAFMIMFRVKISPQAVVTVQSALPKIVIALILVTFSYAIAGFMVDIMYVVIGFIALIFNDQLTSGLFNGFSFLTTGILGTGIYGILILYLLLFMIAFFVGIATMMGSLGVVSMIMPAIALLLTPIVGIVLFVVLLWMMFKVFFALLKAFMSILLLTIFAPIQITLGIFYPGIGFGTWVQNMAANLAVFPVAGLFITLSFIFLKTSFQLMINNLGSLASLGNQLSDFVNSILGGSLPNLAGVDGWPPLIGVSGGMLALSFLFISLMLMFMIPKASDIIKGIITGRPYPYGSAIGSAISAPANLSLMYGGYRAGKEVERRKEIELQTGIPQSTQGFQSTKNLFEFLQKNLPRG